MPFRPRHSLLVPICLGWSFPLFVRCDNFESSLIDAVLVFPASVRRLHQYLSCIDCYHSYTASSCQSQCGVHSLCNSGHQSVNPTTVFSCSCQSGFTAKNSYPIAAYNPCERLCADWRYLIMSNKYNNPVWINLAPCFKDSDCGLNAMCNIGTCSCLANFTSQFQPPNGRACSNYGYALCYRRSIIYWRLL